MTLKYQVDALDGLAEPVAALYTKAEDGKYYLGVEGVVPKSKLDEFRDNNVKLLKDMEKYKDIDPVKYKELMDSQKKLDDKKLLEAGDIDKLVEQRVNQMKSDYETKINSLTESNTLSQRQLESLLIDSAVRDAALKSGVQTTAVEDVLLRAKASFQIKDGKAVALENGNIVYGKDGVTPMSVIEWANNLKKSAPHLFLNSQGGGAPGGQGKGNVDMSKMSPIQKIQAGLGK